MHVIVCHWHMSHHPSCLEAISCAVPYNPTVLCQAIRMTGFIISKCETERVLINAVIYVPNYLKEL